MRKERSARVFVIAVSLLAGAPAIGRADVVDNPPRNCPEGSHGETGHAGPYCAPTPCSGDAECASWGRGLECRPFGLCVIAVEYTDWSGQTYTRHEVQGLCDPDTGCTAPATCDAGSKCVPKGPSTTASSGGPTATSASGATSGPTSGAGGGNSGAGGGTAGDDDRRVEGCGCATVGAPARFGGALAAAALTLALAARRRRRAGTREG